MFGQFNYAYFPANGGTDLFVSRAARLYMKMTDSNRTVMTENETCNTLVDSDALFDDYLEPSFLERFCETSGDQPTSAIAPAEDTTISEGSKNGTEGHDASSDSTFHVPILNVLSVPPSLNAPAETSNWTQLGLSSPSRSSPQGSIDGHSDVRLSAPSLPLRGDLSLAGVKVSTDPIVPSLSPFEVILKAEEDEAEESAPGKRASTCSLTVSDASEPRRAVSPPFPQTTLEGPCEVSGDAPALSDIREPTGTNAIQNLEDEETSPDCISSELFETRPETPAPSSHSFDDEAAEGEPLIGTPPSSGEIAVVTAEGAGHTPAKEPTTLGSTPTVPSSSSGATTSVKEPSTPPVPPARAASRKRKRV
ncbi:hypothetical protein ACEPAG_7534 [Sanghuangporus baumii]